MKTIKIFAIAAAVAALAACTKEQAIETGSSFKKGQEVTLNVTADASATKVSSELNGTSVDFKWEEGDKIKVKVGVDSAVFTITSFSADSTVGTFTGTMPADGETFSVQYPVTDPVLTTQTYSSTEAIPHDMMKFAATGCTTSSPTFSLLAQNAALRLNLWGTSQTISKIVVTNTTSSADPKPTYTLNISPSVTLPAAKADSMAFFIVVPAGSWNFSAEVFDNATTPASICTFSPSAAKTFAANQILNMAAKKVEKRIALTGVFTVNSSCDKVNFSPGNLYYDGAFKFEATQYAYTSSYEDNHVCRFRWAENSGTLSTDITSALSTETSLSGTNSDVFFTNADQTIPRPDFTVADQTGVWRTLSSSEWTFLLNSRSGVTVGSTTGCRYAEVKVNSICGLLIFPDTFTWPSDVDASKKPSTFNTYHSSWNSVDYTVAEFTSLQDAGCVFLPAAGSCNGSSLSGVGSNGYYWSSTPKDAEVAYSLKFDSGSVAPSVRYGRYFGSSVRLVSAAQ